MMLFSSGDLVASEVLQFAQLQGFCLLLYFVSIDPIPRPSQYFGPVRLSHPAECNQSSPKSKCPLNQEVLQIPAQSRFLCAQIRECPVGRAPVLTSSSRTSADRYLTHIQEWH